MVECVRKRILVFADGAFQIWKTVKLPFGESVSKPATQELVHAVEELYFFKRYDEAAALVRRVFSEGNGDVLDRESKKLLRDYESRCLGRLAKA